MPTQDKPLAPFPIDAARWAAVVEHLKLGPQQARIAKLVVLGMKDKEIMQELQIAKGTLRTYLGRLNQRAGAQDRVQLVVRLFSLAMSLDGEGPRRPVG